MAEKKFFVDINLQGSALTNAKIGINTGINSTEGAFAYNSGKHRLEYFDGTATKEIANLSDIAAVTGGLIFQGGYDPTTDTPDITDGTALKGFLWVATAAGTFLGESVQVGDSIVAKVDYAGATIADWLILQGNIVIATDSVDGISRLATQAEADAGTEAGAVVITPATLQGKIDAQITPEISNKLPLAGGTMSGEINMGGSNIANVSNIAGKNGDRLILSTGATIEGGNLDANSNKITNVPAPTNGGDAANKTYVDDQDALKLSLTGGTMSGAIDMGGENIFGVFNIYTSQITGADGSPLTLGSNIDADGNAITNLPAPTNGGDAANKTYVDGEVATALPLAGGIMTGNIDMGTRILENATQVQALVVNTNLINSPLGEVALGSPVNADLNPITNLPAPTGDGDATNKLYVDTAASTAQANAEAYADSLAPNYDAAGAAATAESNANDYTDTEIAAQKYHIIIPNTEGVGGWTFGSGVYAFTIQHNLNSEFILASFQMNGWSVEFDWGKGSANTAYVVSNSLPPSEIYASIVKA